MNALPGFIYVPLAQLQLSPRNARKTTAGDVEGLAASIAANGLLQNLTVQIGANDPDAHEVIAGGRRLAALQLLEREGRLPPTLAQDGVPCKLIIDDAAALEASTAENTLREAMHPADQFEAFRGMVDAGKAVADVAAHFGVSELVVRQRLKLANLSPKLLEVYRDGKMDLEQLQALALTEDHAAQEKLWFGSEPWQRRAAELRSALTKREIRSDAQIARFVGIDAYEAAGGPVRRDLFSDVAYLGDKALLDTLALDQLEALAERERQDGWSWAQAFLSLDYSQLGEYPRHSEPKLSNPTREDGDRIKAINARLDTINAMRDEDDCWSDHIGDDQVDALEAETTELENERSTLSTGRQIWPGHAKGEAGVLVYLGYNGVEIQRGRLKPGQRVDGSGQVTGTAKPSAAERQAGGDSSPKPSKPARVDLSDNMVRRLSMHRTLALQEEVARRPAIALQLLVTHLISQVIARGDGTPLLQIRHSNALDQHAIAIRGGWTDLESAPAMVALQARLGALKNQASGKGGHAGIAAFVAKASQAEQLGLLALCVATSIDATVQSLSARHEQANALSTLIGLDMSIWWQPTHDTYLAQVPKALVAEAVADVKGKAAGDALLELKKDEAIAQAAQALVGTGWLPKPLRGTGYGAKKAANAAAAPKAKSAAKKAGPAAPAKAKPTAKKATKKTPAAKKPTKTTTTKAAKPAPKKGKK